MTYYYRDLYALWQKIYDAQIAKGSPLTVREMMPLINVRSSSAADYLIKLLMKADLLVSQPAGKYHRYIAVDNPKELP